MFLIIVSLTAATGESRGDTTLGAVDSGWYDNSGSHNPTIESA